MGKGINFQPLLCTFTKNAVLWRKQILGKDILLLLLRKTKVLILQLNNRVLQEKALYKCFIEEFTGHDLCHYILNGLRIHKWDSYTLLVLVNIVHNWTMGSWHFNKKEIEVLFVPPPFKFFQLKPLNILKNKVYNTHFIKNICISIHT